MLGLKRNSATEVDSGDVADRRLIDIPTLAIATAFFLLGLVGLAEPAGYVFDEGFYVPTAVRLARGLDILNREHPMLAKELLAAWFRLFGVSALTWRMLPLLCGSIAIYAAGMAMEGRGSGRLSAGLLALSGLPFVLSRLGILEPFYLMFCALAVWSFVRENFWASGIAFGLAIASKWSAAPLLACFYVFHALRYRDKQVRGLLLLGFVPSAVYFMSYLPLIFFNEGLTINDILPLQRAMVKRHEFVGPLHPYASQAWEWVLGQGTFWLNHGGRGILLAGNPVLNFAMLPAVAWGLRKGWAEAYTFLALLIFWTISPKSNLFLYHYVLPSAFGVAALSRVITPHPKISIALTMASTITFAFMYPAFTGNPRAIHFAIWPDRPGTLRPLDGNEREDFERREYCLYHPAKC